MITIYQTAQQKHAQQKTLVAEQAKDAITQTVVITFAIIILGKILSLLILNIAKLAKTLFASKRDTIKQKQANKNEFAPYAR